MKRVCLLCLFMGAVIVFSLVHPVGEIWALTGNEEPAEFVEYEDNPIYVQHVGNGKAYYPGVSKFEDHYNMGFSGEISSSYSIYRRCYLGPWTKVYDSSNRHEFFWDITHNGFRYVIAAGGDLNYVIYTSEDAINWTPRSAPFNNPLYVITYSNGLFVAGGWRGALTTSTDGIQWTDRSPGITDEIHGIAYNPGLNQWLAVTAANPSNTLASYDNGQTWQIIHTAFGIKADLIYVNGQYVAVGNTKIYTSIDGTSWVVKKNLEGSLYWFRAITYGNGLYVAVGSPGAIFTSTNLINWTQRSSGTSVIIYDVIYADSEFVAVGNPYLGSDGLILTSPDGITWSDQPSDTSTRMLLGVTYNACYKRAVAVGNWSTVTISDCI